MNKIQLNAIAEGLFDPEFHSKVKQKHWLMITGVNDVPVEIFHGMEFNREEMCASHDETDVLITQHVT